MDTVELLKKIKLLEIKTKAITKQVFSGEYHAAFKGRGMTFSEVREYQPGDDIRTIDWNVTARFNSPFVKVFDEERDLNVLLLIDLSGSNNFGLHEKLKKSLALELAAILCFSAISNNDKVGAIFITDSVEKFIPAKKGRKHALMILREMIEFKPTSNLTKLSSGFKFLQQTQKKRSTVFAISDFKDENSFLDAMAIARKKHDLVAIRIEDKAEEMLPDLGIVPLKNVETGKINWVNTSDPSFIEHYQSLHQEEKLATKKEFRKRGIDYTEVSTEADYYKALIELFHKRIKS
jgi:uncharacterized protein (DUF58 family)